MEARANTDWLQIAGLDLRSTPGILAARAPGPAAHLPRTGRKAGAVRKPHGLHPPGTAAAHGASLLGFVGLPGDRLLRPTSRFGTPGRFQVFRGRLPSGRHRRHCGLGAGALPQGRPRAGVLRRHGALRARRSAQGRAPRLGHPDLQLRPQRSAHLPDFERALLAEGVSHRRPARGRRGLHAVPGLLAPARRVDPQSVRRQRKPGSDRLPAPLQRTGPQRARRLHGGRGIHRLPRRLQARLPERPGLHHEVEHGLDARHAGLFRLRPGVPQVPPQPHHLQHAVRLHARTSCCPFRTTRWSTASARC